MQIPAYDLDDYYWQANWQPKDLASFAAEIKGIIEQSSWIIAGNYSQIKPLLLAKVDTIIWLDYSFCRCLWQAFGRSIRGISPICVKSYGLEGIAYKAVS